MAVMTFKVNKTSSFTIATACGKDENGYYYISPLRMKLKLFKKGFHFQVSLFYLYLNYVYLPL